MLDNLRDQAASTPFFEEEIPGEQSISAEETRKARSKPFLGLSAPQRFLIVVMLFFVVCLMGAMFLMFTGKMVPSLLG